MENHRISIALVAIAALASVLVASTSVISGHIAIAQMGQTNSGIDDSQSNTATGTCSTAGGHSPMSNSCTATQINTNNNTGGVH